MTTTAEAYQQGQEAFDRLSDSIAERCPWHGSGHDGMLHLAWVDGWCSRADDADTKVQPRSVGFDRVQVDQKRLRFIEETTPRHAIDKLWLCKAIRDLLDENRRRCYQLTDRDRDVRKLLGDRRAYFELILRCDPDESLRTLGRVAEQAEGDRADAIKEADWLRERLRELQVKYTMTCEAFEGFAESVQSGGTVEESVRQILEKIDAHGSGD